MTFTLTRDTAAPYLVRRGLVPADVAIHVDELPGGVSAAVIAVRVPATGLAVVVKQALPQLRVRDEWLAKPERAETEVEAMRLCAAITPGVVPRILDSDPVEHVLVMELLPEDALNWQAEVGEGRVHPSAGVWAGATLGTWHAATTNPPPPFHDFEAFEQLRLRPFHETTMARLPDQAPLIAPYLADLRNRRRCLVHGDYSMKNMLLGPSGRFVLDFEVAHVGNPVFDLAFFLSFVVLSAIRWPQAAAELEELAGGFLTAYATAAGNGFAGDITATTGQTACLLLARTDGKSPALFLDEPSRVRARAIGTEMLSAPERGLWAWA